MTGTTPVSSIQVNPRDYANSIGVEFIFQYVTPGKFVSYYHVPVLGGEKIEYAFPNSLKGFGISTAWVYVRLMKHPNSACEHQPLLSIVGFDETSPQSAIFNTSGVFVV